MTVLTDDELLYILETQIPGLLDRHPELEQRVYTAFVKTFARREEVAAIMAELRELHHEFGEFRQEPRGRFERVDQRFDQVDQRFDQVDQRLDTMSQQFQDLRDWVELVVGRLQVRSGHKLENVVAGALRLALNRPDIRPESIRLRQKITDVEGRVFPRGRTKEVDLVASDNEYLVFEVKSAAEPEDVENFAEKVELVRLLNPDKSVQGVFITLAPEPDVQQRCQELGVELAS